MTHALGIYQQKIDSRGRIFVNGPMRKYFDLKKGEDSGKDAYVGKPEKLSDNALVILNEEFADAITMKTRDEDLAEFSSIPTEESSNPFKYIQDNFHPREIKSNRIQLRKNEVKRLKLPKNDNRVIIRAAGIRFIVWSLSEFKKRYPEKYQMLDLDDDDDE